MSRTLPFPGSPAIDGAPNPAATPTSRHTLPLGAVGAAEPSGEVESEPVQLRRNLELARAEIRRLEAAIRAPRPVAIARYTEKLESGELGDVLVCAMTDGSMREYRPRLARGQRFADAEPIPSSAASILADRRQWQ